MTRTFWSLSLAAVLAAGCAHPFEDALGVEDPVAAKPVDYDLGIPDASQGDAGDDEADAAIDEADGGAAAAQATTE